MHPVDWIVVVTFTAWIVYDGLKRTKNSHELEGYFLANRSIPWWAAGLSVMATQLSAITMIGTTGQAYADGMRFIQFYFGLPLAMILLCVTLVPFFYNSGVYTAYEYLERRFDAKTRSATSLLFLLSRGFSVGVVVSAPAVVLSLVLGWNLTATSLAIALPAILYTMFGGVQAVTWTDVKTMTLIVFGLFALIGTAWLGLPSEIGLADGLAVAAATGRLESFDFSFDLTEQYTFWSGTIAAVFLFCSYFGTDQSQVQRYLTARSVDEARHSLLMSAYWKIPLQALVLIVGVLVFVFYTFTPAPMIFSSAADRAMRSGPAAEAYSALESEYAAAFASRTSAATELAHARHAGDADRLAAAQSAMRDRDEELDAVRASAMDLVRRTEGDGAFNDVNYIIPTFILTELPVGLIGLLMVAILMAATDTIAGELNSLATATVMDFYKRWVRHSATDRHYLVISRMATGFWGLFACVVAVWAAELGSLIEVVNRFGSFFYGSILGVFVLAIAFPRATANGAFVGLIAGMISVAWAANYTNVAFLWHNVIGVVAVVAAGVVVSLFDPARQRPAA
ncbi:MAG: sodium:solute symporter [Vicinamibacterales bacterium]